MTDLVLELDTSRVNQRANFEAASYFAFEPVRIDCGGTDILSLHVVGDDDLDEQGVKILSGDMLLGLIVAKAERGHRFSACEWKWLVEDAAGNCPPEGRNYSATTPCQENERFSDKYGRTIKRLLAVGSGGLHREADLGPSRPAMTPAAVAKLFGRELIKRLRLPYKTELSA